MESSRLLIGFLSSFLLLLLLVLDVLYRCWYSCQMLRTSIRPFSNGIFQKSVVYVDIWPAGYWHYTIPSVMAGNFPRYTWINRCSYGLLVSVSNKSLKCCWIIWCQQLTLISDGGLVGSFKIRPIISLSGLRFTVCLCKRSIWCVVCCWYVVRLGLGRKCEVMRCVLINWLDRSWWVVGGGSLVWCFFDLTWCDCALYCHDITMAVHILSCHVIMSCHDCALTWRPSTSFKSYRQNRRTWHARGNGA